MRWFDKRQQESQQSHAPPWPGRGKGEPKQRDSSGRNDAAVCGNGNRRFQYVCDLERGRRGLQRRSVWYHFEWRPLHATGEYALACKPYPDSDQRGGPYENSFGDGHPCNGSSSFVEH
jgi:hypothetical protein